MHTDMPEWTGWPEPGPLVQRLLRREVGRWWWVPLAAGVIWFIIAWLVLRANVTSLATVGLLVGVAFLLAAANEAAVGGFLIGGWKVAHYALAVLFVLSAVWAFVRPVGTFFALASVLGLILLLQGAFSIIRGVALRDLSPYWSLEVFSGVLISLLGFWVSVSDRVFGLGGRAVFILLWVGFMAIFRGTSNIALAFTMLWYAKRGDRISVPERPAPPNGPRQRLPETPPTSRG
jgi:uncharacterized membrane protein HdeD (DUF308 family)